jgi:hypothetical protein
MHTPAVQLRDSAMRRETAAAPFRVRHRRFADFGTVWYVDGDAPA